MLLWLLPPSGLHIETVEFVGQSKGPDIQGEFFKFTGKHGHFFAPSHTPTCGIINNLGTWERGPEHPRPVCCPAVTPCSGGGNGRHSLSLDSSTNISIVYIRIKPIMECWISKSRKRTEILEDELLIRLGNVPMASPCRHGVGTTTTPIQPAVVEFKFDKPSMESRVKEYRIQSLHHILPPCAIISLRAHHQRHNWPLLVDE